MKNKKNQLQKAEASGYYWYIKGKTECTGSTPDSWKAPVPGGGLQERWGGAFYMGRLQQVKGKCF